jgi:hypothetical protein
MRSLISSYELSLLAKEKGYNVSGYNMYHRPNNNNNAYLTTGDEYQSERDCKWDWNLNGGESGGQTNLVPYPNTFKPEDICSAPGLFELQTWLLEKKSIQVYAYSSTVGIVAGEKAFRDFIYVVNPLNGGAVIQRDHRDGYKTFLKALEKGLEEALKTLPTV